jgi:glycerophosphoryl diester phosphodiesterase
MSLELVAHRGYAARYPENTLAALEAAIAAGARHVEVDVQLSSDGFPVLFHDRTLDRMCGVPGTIHGTTLSDLRALSCGERAKFGDRFQSEGLLSLAGFVQLLRRHPDVRAFVEIKRVAIENFGRERILERVLPALDAAIHQCALISFSLEFLAAARRAHPIPLGAVFDAWALREDQLAAEIAPEFVFVDLEGLPATGELRVPGAKVVVYEVADPAVARALERRGVDMVETFEIEAMLAALRAPAP